jgi:hypothetical protein
VPHGCAGTVRQDHADLCVDMAILGDMLRAVLWESVRCFRSMELPEQLERAAEDGNRQYHGAPHPSIAPRHQLDRTLVGELLMDDHALADLHKRARWSLVDQSRKFLF